MRHRPTPETRALVERLAGYGIPEETIAREVGGGLTVKGLRAEYRRELVDGPAKLKIRLLDRLTLIGQGTDENAAKALRVVAKIVNGEDVGPEELPAGAMALDPPEPEPAAPSLPETGSEPMSAPEPPTPRVLTVNDPGFVPPLPGGRIDHGAVVTTNQGYFPPPRR